MKIPGKVFIKNETVVAIGKATATGGKFLIRYAYTSSAHSTTRNYGSVVYDCKEERDKALSEALSSFFDDLSENERAQYIFLDDEFVVKDEFVTSVIAQDENKRTIVSLSLFDITCFYVSYNNYTSEEVLNAVDAQIV